MKRKISILILCCLITTIFLFPVIFNMNCYIPGTSDTNETYGYLWYFWSYKQASLQGSNSIYLVAYPFGMDFSKLFHYPIYSSINKIALKVTAGILYFNLNVIFSFILTFIATYLLVYGLIKETIPAFISALIFTYCPYHFVRVWQQMGLAHIEFYVLGSFSLLVLSRRRDIMAFLFFIATSFLIFSFDLYYGYFFFITAATFIIYYLVVERKKGTRLKFIGGIAISSVVIGLLLIPEILLLIKGFRSIGESAGWKSTYIRPFQDLFTQSAKPLSYLLPATAHPIFGKFTEQFIGSPLYGISYTEHALYLGWVPLILAFVAVRRWRNNRKGHHVTRSPGRQLGEKDSFYIGFFVWLALVAWLFSQPPYFTFPYFKIYMPSFFMYKLLPMFRAYCRFGIVVMLAVSVLAGFGLKFVLERFKTKRARATFASLVCGLVLFEFLNFPPFKVIDLTKYPLVYDWLKQEEGNFAIAEYPLDTESPNEYYKFCQTIHEKKIINGTTPGTYANRVTKSIWRLSEPRTPGVLSWMKVKYVLVHLDAYEKSNDIDVLGELEKIKTGKMNGLEFVKNLDGVDVYEVIAKPKAPEIDR